jgi:uncharacterized membrane protein YhdT
MAQSTEQDGGTSVGNVPGTETGAPSGSADEPLRRFLPRVYRINAVLTIVGVIAARVAGADLFAVNFFVGSIIGLSMLYITAWLVRRYVTPGAHIKRNRNRLFLLLLAKLPLLGIVLFLVTSGDWFHPIGLLTGVSMTPLTLTLCGLSLLRRQDAGNERDDWTAALNKPKRSYR